MLQVRAAGVCCPSACATSVSYDLCGGVTAGRAVPQSRSSCTLLTRLATIQKSRDKRPKEGGQAGWPRWILFVNPN